MPSQLLVNVITATVPATGSITVPHGLRSNDKPVAPKLILPSGSPAVMVGTITDTTIEFINGTEAPITATFRVERGLSMEVDAETLEAVVVGGGAGGGGGGEVESVGVITPITNVGTAEAPIIGVSVGSAGGTVCAGNDVRLSDQRVPTAASVTTDKVAAANKDGTAGTPSMRTLGTGAQQACAGNDSRLSNERIPVNGSVTTAKLAALSPSPAGTVGSSTRIPVLSVNSAGQVTSATTVEVATSVGSVSVTAPITNSGTATAPIIGLANKSPNPTGVYGTSSQIPRVTVDAKGLVTSVALQPNLSMPTGTIYTVTITDDGFEGLDSNGKFPVPPDTNFVIVKDNRTAASDPVRRMPSIGDEDMLGSIVPVGRRITIYSDYNNYLSAPGGYYFEFIDTENPTEIPTNLIQGPQASAANFEITPKRFYYGCVSEIMYVGTGGSGGGAGLWRMMSFQAVAQYFY